MYKISEKNIVVYISKILISNFIYFFINFHVKELTLRKFKLKVLLENRLDTSNNNNYLSLHKKNIINKNKIKNMKIRLKSI